jgi:hypothetical protein
LLIFQRIFLENELENGFLKFKNNLEWNKVNSYFEDLSAKWVYFSHVAFHIPYASLMRISQVLMLLLAIKLCKLQPITFNLPFNINLLVTTKNHIGFSHWLNSIAFRHSDEDFIIALYMDEKMISQFLTRDDYVVQVVKA